MQTLNEQDVQFVSGGDLATFGYVAGSVALCTAAIVSIVALRRHSFKQNMELISKLSPQEAYDRGWTDGWVDGHSVLGGL
ncbi:MAG: hypothetical protein ACHQJ6_04635 [Candidatus Berkiellales bacterium]